MSRGELAARLYEASHLVGTFTLRSGAVSGEYFDKYRFESDPALLAEIAAQLEPLVPAGTEVLAGLELGGVPLATALSARLGLPVAFVRKAAKSYGTCRLAEGVPVGGRRLTVVEDVVTSGGQLVRSTEDLRAEGATVEDALCVIDRESGGTEALGRAGVRLESLFRMGELGGGGAGGGATRAGL
ncbi:MAG: orotate phosphoribosyltransferase [Acidimicrobiales bacterium]